MPYLTPEPPPPNLFVVRRLRIPQQIDFLGLINGALNEMCNHWNYEQYGTLTPVETAEIMLDIYNDYSDSSGFMIGQITPYVTENPPVFCLDCDGGTYNRVDYPNLYALLDPIFKIDADTFVTPNINRGDTIIGAGTSPVGSIYDVGDTGGEEEHSLSSAENGEHFHTTNMTTGLAVSPGELPVNIPTPLPLGTTNNSGLGVPHNNMMPFTALKFCVVAK